MGIAVTSQQKLEKIYKQVLGDYKDQKEFLWKHRGSFVHYVQSGVADGVLDQRFTRKNFRLERLSYALDPSRDKLLSATALDMLSKAMLLRKEDILRETPQYYWMRLAMTFALETANPTREALKMYDKLSHGMWLELNRSEIFNSQKLLFEITRPVTEAGALVVPDHYYRHGWAVLDGIADEYEAIERQQDFINSILASVLGAPLPLQRRFRDRIQLAKADQIPVCDDIVSTSFQVLHFDMGHPFLESDNQLFVSHVGLYLPKTTNHTITARTRLVELGGILKHLKLTSEQIETKIKSYVKKYGDGWTGHNTLRLACFIRFLDALSEKPELQDQINKTVGQWFENDHKVDEASAHQKEMAFYAKHGIKLSEFEHQVLLKPGQLLILDNTRVVHGRIGERRAKEVFNYMWGIESIDREDITALRQSICKLVAK